MPMRPSHAWPTLLLAALAGLLHAAPPESPDPGWILQKIARQAPASTPFVELRDSPLLKAPLRLQGRYARPAADTLVREVQAPYRETTTLRGQQATLVRPGRPERRFDLARAPQLALLQDSFGALLAGDRARLDALYRLQADGSRQQWRLELVPREPALAAQLRVLRLFGSGAELRCIESEPAQGPAQRTLLAGAAATAATLDDADALAALCHGQRR